MSRSYDEHQYVHPHDVMDEQDLREQTPALDSDNDNDWEAANGSSSMSMITTGTSSAAAAASSGLTSSRTSSEGCLSSSEEGEGDEERAYVAGCFEGPEKTLEVCFKPGVGHPQGCRQLSREQLDLLCKQVRG